MTEFARRRPAFSRVDEAYQHRSLGSLPRPCSWLIAGASLALSACALPDNLRMNAAENAATSQLSSDHKGSVSRGHDPVPEFGDDFDQFVLNFGNPEVDLASTELADESPAYSESDFEPGLTGLDNLWERVRARFELELELRPRMARELDWFRRNQEYMDRVSDRARLYMHHIVSEVERRDLPGELALLPVVESAYQPFAYSPARASGIWQFIPSTGRLYGLHRTWWYDGRRDVVESTRAALDYLEKLHAEFSGDWLLALAAYNSGEGNVRKAIRRNLRAGKPVDFFSLRLPRETRSYVPRLLAVAAIVADPAEHGLTLKSIPDQPYFASAELDGQIDLALAAELAQVSLDELYLLNPGFSRWATDPDGPHRLLLPVDAVSTFEQRLSELPREQRIQWRRHVIKRGDTLGTIAGRYRTSVSALKQANNLRGTMIREGRSLMIPVSSRSLSDYRLSADMRRAMRRRAPGSGRKIIYRVRRGDSLWVISQRFGVSVNKLAAWNGLSKRSVLRPGKRLVIWHGNTPARNAEKTPVVTKVSTASNAAPGNATEHVVRRGENLWIIARRYRVPSRSLAEWNGIGPGDLLQPGQKLYVTPRGEAAEAPASAGNASRFGMI